MKIGFACDHAAVGLKNTLLEYLKEKGYECVDYGVNDPTKPWPPTRSPASGPAFAASPIPHG